MPKLKTVPELIAERYDGSKKEKIAAFADDWNKPVATVKGWFYGRPVCKDSTDKFNSFDSQKENDAHIERKRNGEMK